MKRWMRWSAALALLVAVVPYLMGAIETDTKFFQNDVYFEQQTNHVRGWKVGTTGYDMDASGNLDAATVDSAGVVTGTGFTIGSAALVEAELEQLDTVTAGTRVANKAVVLGATSSIDAWTVLGGLIAHGTSTLNGAVTTTGTVTAAGFTIGSAALVEAELEQLDTVTAGTKAASKAVVLGATAAIDSWRVLGNEIVDGSVTAGSITTTGTLTGLKNVIAVTTDTVLSAAQVSGTVILMTAAQGDTTVTLTLPTAAAGYNFTMIDADVTAGANVKIQAPTGDKINGGTAAKAYDHGNAETAVGVAKFLAQDDTDWVLDGPPMEAGVVNTTNWKNNNS